MGAAIHVKGQEVHRIFLYLPLQFAVTWNYGEIKPTFKKDFLVASLVTQRLKHLPPLQETQVWSLGQEDPLEKEMVTHSSILAWWIPWTEKPSRLQSTGSQRVGHDWMTSLFFTFKKMHSKLWELRQEGRISTCSTLAVNVCDRQCKSFASLNKSTNDHRSTVRTDFGVTNKF